MATIIVKISKRTYEHTQGRILREKPLEIQLLQALPTFLQISHDCRRLPMLQEESKHGSYETTVLREMYPPTVVPVLAWRADKCKIGSNATQE